MKTLIILLLLCSTAYAEPNLMATGYDYVLMNDNQKTELVNTLYTIFKVDKNVKAPEDGVLALDGLYYIYSHEVKNSKNEEKAIETVFARPVMSIIAEILTMPSDTKPDEETMKKYGLRFKK